MAPEASPIFNIENLPNDVTCRRFIGARFVFLQAKGDDMHGKIDDMFHQLVINNVNTDAKCETVRSFIKYANERFSASNLHLIQLPDVQKDNLDMVHCRYIVVKTNSAVEEASQTVLTVWYMVDDNTFATTRAYKKMLYAKATETPQSATQPPEATPVTPPEATPVTPLGTLHGTVYSLKLQGKQVCHPDDPTLKKYVWLGNIDANFRRTDRSETEYFAYQGHFLVKCTPALCVVKNPVAQAIHAALDSEKYKLSGLYLLSARTDPVVVDDNNNKKEVPVYPLYEYDLSPYVVLSSVVPDNCVYEDDGEVQKIIVPGIPDHLAEVSGLGMKYSKFVCSAPAIEIKHIVA